MTKQQNQKKNSYKYYYFDDLLTLPLLVMFLEFFSLDFLIRGVMGILKAVLTKF